MSSGAQVSKGPPNACIARQPILTVEEKVLGYELFFRESEEDRHFGSVDGDKATSETIDTLNVVGLQVLCDGQLAFLNCSRETLLGDHLALLRPQDLVIEIQANVPPDAEVVHSCERLKQEGYRIALDNFVPDDNRSALAPYADFIKIDILALPREVSAALAKQYASEHCRMVAQRVETRETFVQAGNTGFTLFQGYFFRRPESLRVRRIPANQATYVQLLNAVSKAKIDYEEIEGLIKREPSLCYRLLRYLNSPLLRLSSPVTSVRHALNLLGEREVVKWIRMATTLAMGQERCPDLVLSSLVRARFCELIGAKIEHGQSDLFLLGMLSLMDAILALPIGMVIEELQLDRDIKVQLIGAKTGQKTPLSGVYDLMIAREVGNWEQVSRLGKELNLSLSFVGQQSNEAMRWAHQVTHVR